MEHADECSNTLKLLARPALVVTCATVLCAGCAASPAQEDARVAYRAPIYMTGSRIPVGREASGTTTSATENPAPNDWQNLLPPQTVHGTPGGGY